MRATLMFLPLAIGLLAGCIQAEDDGEDPLFGVCPHWQQRDTPVDVAIRLSGDGDERSDAWAPRSPINGSPALEHEGLVFDRVHITVDTIDVQDAVLVLEARAAQRDLLFYDYNAGDHPDTPSRLRFVAGDDYADHRYEVYLSSVKEGSAQDPAPVHLMWRLEGNGTASADVVLTFYDRVCGAP